MPKKYGVKEKDLVVTHIINLVMTGKLRTGDRIDRNEIVRDLGLSRVPIQEAVVQLEHDGILSTRYHRGAFVARFDEATVAEHHELYGMLNGIASARCAANPTPRILADLDDTLRSLRAAKDTKSFQEACWVFRDAINNEYAGPRLQATIRAGKSFAPSEFWLTYPKAKADFLAGYEEETAAIHNRDPETARRVCLERSQLMARIMISELTRRGVFGELRSP
ncbi:GntR family transcriptional regulator [Mycolicibacterium mageritense DSM 44476 = CIP 104973]|mgnify:CR=1 FL=1|uniref:GntR family transcriptional regulator n=1 Tax=Mycolicibacterium mageritense TaxID=53462 RepID=A0AAI8TNV9_MYCME|nr:GntR family transcriptional regulator [Mycolicibacterium mageritense]MBN3457534.1 GntR family transcriptional regulator [Mycobacterium sp. DSM 3803]OKH81152.1 GntR family transcriptional regulator [Mycobacterium sp. SWH-M3]MCC9184911.1 GntR family transcriptional regulator [Mycolicibacterium mageritense]TXI54919.1 MAG: GntR family transcriptional regulator [Mycolicibacterium mageritense]CDO21627.1 HTH-type transcriptional regulator [Mycolicibacterium mageritense DSM 44476 = CIP 104973]